MIKKVARILAILILSGVYFFPQISFACGDCEDEWCVVGCICVPNAGRCPPKLSDPPRHDFCNITNDSHIVGGKPSCQNCSSLLDGDAGKTDCLARQQGNYVQFGKCNPSECSRIASVLVLTTKQYGAFKASSEQMKANKLTPKLLKAQSVTVESLTSDTKPAKAVALLTDIKGKVARCKYTLDVRSSLDDNTKVQYLPKTEQCNAIKNTETSGDHK